MSEPKASVDLACPVCDEVLRLGVDIHVKELVKHDSILECAIDASLTDDAEALIRDHVASHA